MSEITVAPLQPEHIPALVKHQQICFPTMELSELFLAEHFAAHLCVFPEGQYVALADDRVVGESSTFRIRGEHVFIHHEFNDIVGHGYFTRHDPEGEWLYGADMSVHPEYRKRGIASKLYAARKTLIHELGMRGMVAGGMIPGFPQYRDEMDVETYVAEVVAGRLKDPTLTPQLRNGFEVRGVLHNHIHAGELGTDATLIVWERES